MKTGLCIKSTLAGVFGADFGSISEVLKMFGMARTRTSIVLGFVLVACSSQVTIAQNVLPATEIDFGSIRVSGEGFAVTRSLKVMEQAEQAYTVSVPYSEQLSDGRTVTKTRTETRTRTVTVPRMVAEEIRVPANAISFSSVAGKKVTDFATVRKLLAKPRPAVIKYDPEPLGDYYKQVLNSRLVVVHIDMKQMPPPAPPEVAPTSETPAASDLFGTP